MAGSRRESIGTIITRLRGLLRSGALKYEERPLWYDVVTAKPPLPTPPPKTVQKIFYPEDFIRVQFYKTYADPHPVNLADEKRPSAAQRFVDKYLELRSQSTDDSVNLFEETAAQLRREGIRLLTHEEKQAGRTARGERPAGLQSTPQRNNLKDSQSPHMDSLLDNLFETDKKK